MEEQWTESVPSTSGYYWQCYDWSDKPTLYQVYASVDGKYRCRHFGEPGHVNIVRNVGGLWQGPVKAPLTPKEGGKYDKGIKTPEEVRCGHA